MPISATPARAQNSIGYLDENTRAIFGRSYAAEPDKLVKALAEDEAIAAADTLLLTVPNQLGVDYNAHAIEAVLTQVGPGTRVALKSESDPQETHFASALKCAVETAVANSR